jgi:hypothetical protein
MKIQCVFCEILKKYGVSDPNGTMCSTLTNFAFQLPSDGELGKIVYSDPSRNQNYRARIGRFVKKFFGKEIPGLVVQQIVAEVTTKIFGSVEKVRELRGEDLREFYLEDNSGINTCMAYLDTQDFLNIYVDNPDVVSLATVVFDGHAARALVWTINDKRYMDRIYETSDACKTSLLQYARLNNILPRGEMKNLAVEMKIRDGKYSYWPYVDTMSYVNIISKKLCELSTEPIGYVLDFTNGKLECTYCCICDEVIDGEPYYLNDDTLCEYCYDHETFECEHCGDQQYMSAAVEIHNGDLVCSYCIQHSYLRCECCKQFY